MAVTLTLGACGGDGPGAPAAPTPVAPEPEPAMVEFTGAVVEPYPYWNRMEGVPGVAVTLVGGVVDGRSTVTAAEGAFTFADYPACERGSAECRARRIRVEKPGYETREESLNDVYRYIDVVGAERVLKSPVPYRWSRDFRQVVIGHVWPRDAQLDRLRAEVAAVEPLWLVFWYAERWPGGGAGRRSIRRRHHGGARGRARADVA